MSPEALLQASQSGEQVEFLPDPAGIISAEAARDFGTEVYRIFREHGTTGPMEEGDKALNIVLQEASDPSSPLHKHLEWDDSIAGHKHRLDQCRRLDHHDRQSDGGHGQCRRDRLRPGGDLDPGDECRDRG